ncbi:MAG: DUF1501 domain-containing protein [Planctomycetota bacterium]|nr:DUF1501 domain-containing protein [Planctomycetota bacterium]
MSNRSHLTTRRDFLQKGLGLLSASLVVPSWLSRTAYAIENPLDVRPLQGRPGIPDERILIVLQLSGGNDILSTIVPYGMDEYYSSRKVAAIPSNRVLKLNDQIGMHPNLEAMKSIFDDGNMSIIQAVGYPNPNRSHFKSMEVWHTANRKAPYRSPGWLGHLIESSNQGVADSTTAISIGNEAPKALIGNHYRGVAFQNPALYAWHGTQLKTGKKGRGRSEKSMDSKSPQQLQQSYSNLNRSRQSGNSSLDFLSSTATNANASSAEVRQAIARFKPTGKYTGRLGNDAKMVAAMIAGGLKTRIYYLSLGGFDTHSSQRNRHDRLMLELSTNVKALMTDLKRTGHDERVLMMSFSEFGRRVAENASGGTDHGSGGGMFLFGTPVQGGIVGDHPSLTELDRGDLQWKTDFRSVYATVIDQWLGGKSAQVLGETFPKLPIL